MMKLCVYHRHKSCQSFHLLYIKADNISQTSSDCKQLHTSVHTTNGDNHNGASLPVTRSITVNMLIFIQ